MIKECFMCLCGLLDDLLLTTEDLPILSGVYPPASQLAIIVINTTCMSVIPLPIDHDTTTVIPYKITPDMVFVLK